MLTRFIKGHWKLSILLLLLPSLFFITCDDPKPMPAARKKVNDSGSQPPPKQDSLNTKRKVDKFKGKETEKTITPETQTPTETTTTSTTTTNNNTSSQGSNTKETGSDNNTKETTPPPSGTVPEVIVSTSKKGIGSMSFNANQTVYIRALNLKSDNALFCVEVETESDGACDSNDNWFEPDPTGWAYEDGEWIGTFSGENSLDPGTYWIGFFNYETEEQSEPYMFSVFPAATTE